jgi:hypothetical protein
MILCVMRIGMKAKDVNTEFELVYGPEAFARPVVKKCRRRFQQGRTDLFDDPRSEKPLINDLCEVKSSILAEKLSSSCRVLCRHFQTEKTACLRIPQDKLSLKQFHLCWESRALSVIQNSERL